MWYDWRRFVEVSCLRFGERGALISGNGPGRFYEPYYVVFARTKEEEQEQAIVHEEEASRRRLEIVHHTIPPWVPLQELVRKYLGVSMRGEVGLSGFADGGEELEAAAKVVPDLDVRSRSPFALCRALADEFLEQLFLTRLTTYLNAFVSRRQGLADLRAYHSSSQHAALDFRIFASEASDRIIVEWNLPTTEEERESDLERLVVVQMAFDDLRSDRLGEGHGTLLARHLERSAKSGAFPFLASFRVQRSDGIPLLGRTCTERGLAQ